MMRWIRSPICEVCSALVHKYLWSCPVCGTPRISMLPLSIRDWLRKDEPYDAAEIRQLMEVAEDPTDIDEESLRASSRWDQANFSLFAKPTEVVWRSFEEEDAARVAIGEPPMTAEERGEYAELLEDMAHSRRHHADYRRKMFAEIDENFRRESTLRYLGGLYHVPAPIDVQVRATEAGIRIVTGRGGQMLAEIPYESIIAVHTSTDRVSLGWYGLQIGHAITFSTPTALVGGLVITYGLKGSIQQVMVGERGPGLFRGAKGPAFMLMLTAQMASVIADFWQVAEHDVGPIQYAAWLGLDVSQTVADVTADLEGGSLEASTRPSKSVGDALRELQELRSEGLITGDEYEKKRSRIVDEL